MSHDPSRKRFLAGVLGIAAAGALAPRELARAVAPAPKGKAEGRTPSFRLVPQARAVARRDVSA